MLSNFSHLGTVAVVLMLVAAPAAAGQTAAQCESNKLRTAGKYGQCLLKASAKAARVGAPSADYTRCDTKLSASWAKVETKGGCTAIGGDTIVAAAAKQHAEAVRLLAPPMASVSAGWYHTCATDLSGAVECWGRNDFGQSKPPADIFTQVSVGIYHTCAISSSGVVKCWGLNKTGQSSSPAGNFTQVAAGLRHTCAVASTGAVECWGGGIDGQAIPPAGTFTQISAGLRHNCAIASTGGVECWGLDDFGQSTPPAGTFTQVSAGFENACAVNGSAGIECWGRDDDGQSTPPAGAFTQVSAGWAHACAINTSGSIECWGLGLGGRLSPPPGSFTQVSAGFFHACAINSLGTVECWGEGSADTDNYGQYTPPLVFRCWASPLKVVGKYGSCRLKAEAKAVKRGTAADFSRCESGFTDKWARVAAKNATRCPAIADLESSFRSGATSYADEIATILAGP